MELQLYINPYVLYWLVISVALGLLSVFITVLFTAPIKKKKKKKKKDVNNK